MKKDSMSFLDQWFVGRETYLKDFKAFIRGEKNYRALFIHGPGGIGKTWLLRKMMKVAQGERLSGLLVFNELIDMYSTANHTVDGVRERLFLLLGNTLGREAFDGFRRSQHELETGIRDHFREETLNSMRQNLQKAFFEDCRELSKNKKVVIFFDTFERVQRDQVGNWVLVELLRNLPNFLFVIASREAWGGNTFIHSRPLGGFSPDEAQEYFGKRGWGEGEREILDVIREKASGHPLRIELAMEFLSGDLLRDIDKLRGLTKDEFEEALITPLQEIGQGLFGSPSFNEAVHQTILFMAYFNRRFNADLLGLFVEQGAVDLRGLQPEEVLGKLEQDFFFIKSRPDGYIQLHDEMERLIQQRLWPKLDPSGEFRRDLARIACQWYDAQIGQAIREEKPLDDLKAEQLVYLLDVDLNKAYDLLSIYGFELDNLLVVEIKPEKLKTAPSEIGYRFAADLGDRARRVNLFERGQEYWKIAVESARQDDDPDRIIDALVGLHNCTHPLDLDESLRILNEALKLCKRSEAKRARVLYEMGFTYSKMQDMERALDFYSQAKDAAAANKDRVLMPTILNDMGYAHVFIGQYKRAGYLVKSALDLRQERVRDLEAQLSMLREKNDAEQRGTLKQQREKLERDLLDARLKLGMSFNTLGQIKRFDGDLSAATGAYSEALEFFRGANDYLWQARALHSRGEAHRRIAETLHGQGRFKACHDYETRAHDDFQQCIVICNQYNYDDELSTALRRMGRLLHDQALREADTKKRLDLLGQAREHFEQGLDVAKRSGNALEEFENLTELAFLVDDRLQAQKQLSGEDILSSEQIQDGDRDIERLRTHIKQSAKAKFKIYQFPVFEHLLEMEEGAFRFIQGNYKDALKFYLDGYKGLAGLPGYGVARYRQHLGHLLKRIRELNDPDEEKRWCKAFITAWRKTKVKDMDQTLAQIHPELVEQVQLYSDTGFLLRE
jgi:tetratricopeptide (TPR) repeat protein